MINSSDNETDSVTKPPRNLRFDQKFIDSWLKDEKFSGLLAKSKKHILTVLYATEIRNKN